MKSFLALVAIAVFFSSCHVGQKKEKSNDTEKAKALTAAGATFPQPYYNLVFKNYTSETGILLTYGGIGSGGGIRSLKDKVVDFGASDAFLDDEKIKDMPGDIVHIPTCLGAVVIAYNLPGVEGIKLTNELLEGLFVGEITNWNDNRLKANNPGLNLPDQAISVIHRSDGSGTTFIFSDFMSKISTKWEAEVGRGKSLKWPLGMGAKGNPGVAGMINTTVGAIGYIGSEYAFAQNIPVAQLQNKAGNYVAPTIETISAAAQGQIPDDTRVMVTNSDDANAYPISGFTWIILYKEQAYDGRSKTQAEATVKFLDWLISEDAQAVASTVHYAPLPAKTVEKAKTTLRSVTYNGEVIIK